MAITVASFRPTGGASQNENIVVRLVDDTYAIDLSTLEISLGSSIGAFTDNTAVFNGVAINGYSIVVTNNNPILNNDYTIRVSFSSILPQWTPGDEVVCAIVIANTNAQGYLFVQTFFTAPYGLVHPPLPTERVSLCSLPTDWSLVATNGGAVPTFGPATIGCQMVTHPNGGTSYIEQDNLDVDFADGFLIEFVFTTSTSGNLGLMKIVEVQKGGLGKFSVSYDSRTQEIYLNDTAVVLPNNYRPALMQNYNMNVFVRLTVKGTDPNNVMARLYAGLNPSLRSPILQQTTFNSTTLGTNENYIRLGVIENTNNVTLNDITFSEVIVNASSLGVIIMTGVDPDVFYASTLIDALSLSNGETAGGETIRLTFDSQLDADFGGEPLPTTDFNTSSQNNAYVRPECTGHGSAAITNGNLTLTLGTAGAGTAAVRFLNAFSGFAPSAIDLTISLQADANQVSAPTSTNVVVAALQFLANGQTADLQLVSDTKLKTYWNLATTSLGKTTVNQFLFNTTQTNHKLRVIHYDTTLLMFLNDSLVYNGTTGSAGPGFLRLYNSCTIKNINLTSTFNNLILRPVIVVGDKIAIDGFFEA